MATDHRLPRGRPCLWCKKPFAGYSNGRQYCSDNCSARGMHARKKQRRILELSAAEVERQLDAADRRSWRLVPHWEIEGRREP